ncbi:MAG: hypothetical protein AAF725_10790 [Acidobacteriota bacterium]
MSADAPSKTSRASAWTLLAGCALLVGAEPLWRQASSSPLGELLSEVRGLPGQPSAGAWSALGQRNRDALAAMDRVETRLDETSPALRAFLPGFQAAMLGWGGVGNRTVAFDRGRQALYLRSGFEHVVGPPFLERVGPGADPRPALLDLYRQLAERSVELLFMPVPSRASFAAPEPVHNPSWRPLLRELEDAGLLIFDPSPALARLESSGQPAYLKTDSHWSPAAVEAVAEALAERLDALVAEGRLGLPTPEAGFTRAPFEQRGRGDLWRLLELPAARPIFPEETVTLQQVTTWDGLFWAPERGAPLMLLGDSFSAVYSDESLHWGRGAGLGEQLSAYTGLAVDRLARPDGASDQVRRDLARQPERLANTRLVIYQVAARELSVGDWPAVDLRLD